VNEAAPQLPAVARQLAEILGPQRCVLVGALAVAVHGYPRATDDVDILTSLDLAEAQRMLRAEGIETVMRRGDVLEGDFPCLTGSLQGVRFDILPQLVTIQWNHVVRVAVDGALLPIVDLEGLLRLKLRAAGPRDLLDAAQLLLRHPDFIAGARELARAYRIEDKLEMWLRDPRGRSEAEEDLRSQGEDGRQALEKLRKLMPRRARKERR